MSVNLSMGGTALVSKGAVIGPSVSLVFVVAVAAVTIVPVVTPVHSTVINEGPCNLTAGTVLSTVLLSILVP